MKLKHPALTGLMQMVYSAEKAAAFAYQGHARSVKNPEEKKPSGRSRKTNGTTAVKCWP